jgi:hypothetical protein
MKLPIFIVTVLVATGSLVPLAAQQPGVSVDKDDVTIRGCVVRAERYTPAEKVPLVWGRNEILVSMSDPMGLRRRTENNEGRLFYWLDDEDLTKHVGKMVEIKGDLEDVEKGEVEVDRKDDYTTIELKFDGKTEKARIPTPWFRAGGPSDDKDYQVVVQRIDVDNVRETGTCDR